MENSAYVFATELDIINAPLPQSAAVEPHTVNFWDEDDKAMAARRRMVFLFGYDPDHLKKKICKRCMRPFVDAGKQCKSIYCSTVCRYKTSGAKYRERHRKPLEAKQCEKCRCGFWPMASTQRFCSNKCRIRARDDRKAAITGIPWNRGAVLKCECGCGKTFTKTMHSKRFATRNCQMSHVRRNARKAKRVLLLRKNPCKYCQKPFFTTRPGKIFCSVLCCRAGDKASREKVGPRQINCLICGKEVITNNGKKKLCGHECYKVWNARKRYHVDKVTKICQWCGATFRAGHSRKIFCCRDHCKKYGAERSKRNYSAATCAMCGTPIQPRTKNDKFCSRKHANAFRRRLALPNMKAYKPHATSDQSGDGCASSEVVTVRN